MMLSFDYTDDELIDGARSAAEHGYWLSAALKLELLAAQAPVKAALLRDELFVKCPA